MHDSGPCAENEIKNFISRFDAHLCAVTPTCAILSKSNTLPCCDVNAHPCAADMYVQYIGNHPPHCCTGGAPFERPPCATPNSIMCYTKHAPTVETDRHCCLYACIPAVRPYRNQSTHSTKTRKTQLTKSGGKGRKRRITGN